MHQKRCIFFCSTSVVLSEKCVFIGNNLSEKCNCHAVKNSHLRRKFAAICQNVAQIQAGEWVEAP